MSSSLFYDESNLPEDEVGGYIVENTLLIREMASTEGRVPAPANLVVGKMMKTELRKLSWYNYSILPKKMKLSNTGATLIVSGKWYTERPFVHDGPLHGSYVFTHVHFHWGKTDNCGSENTINGKRYPMEMHVVHFKSSYKTQEIALTKDDGLAIMVYFFVIQEKHNKQLIPVVQGIQHVRKAHTSVRLKPLPLTTLFYLFREDYFLYWGSVFSNREHNVLWFVCRHPIGISQKQLHQFRKIFDINEEPLVQNFRDVVAHKRTVFHISPVAPDTPCLVPFEENAEHSVSKMGPGHIQCLDQYGQCAGSCTYRRKKNGEDKNIESACAHTK